MLKVWQKISLHRRNDEYLESLLNNWLDQKGRSDEFKGLWHRYDSQKQIWKSVLNRPMDLRLKKIAKKVDERLDLLLNWEKEHLHKRIET